eukprot:6488801-Amphidinium_carterae.2
MNETALCWFQHCRVVMQPCYMVHIVLRRQSSDTRTVTPLRLRLDFSYFPPLAIVPSTQRTLRKITFLQRSSEVVYYVLLVHICTVQ